MWVLSQIALAALASTALYAAALTWLSAAATPLLILAPLPGLLLMARAGARSAVMWCGITASAVGLSLGVDAVPGYLLPLGVPAILLGLSIERRMSFERTMLVGVAATCLGALVLAWLVYGDFAHVRDIARAQLASGLESWISAAAPVATTDNTIALIAADRDLLIDTLMNILPAMAVLNITLAVALVLAALRAVTGLPPGAGLRFWRAPDVLIWALIAGGFGMFAPIDAVSLIASNVFMLVIACYFYQGLAIVSFYLERIGVPRVIRFASYGLIVIQNLLAVLVLLLGVFDLWVNFRRLNVGPAKVRLDTDGE